MEWFDVAAFWSKNKKKKGKKQKKVEQKYEPMIEGSKWSEFLSTFKFVSFTKFPIDNGNSSKKFSVRINSCKFSHLKSNEKLKIMKIG